MTDGLISRLSSRRFNFSRRVKTCDYSTIRAGGVAEIFAMPNSAKEYISIIEFLTEYGAPFCVVGGLSNTLVATDIYEGVIVCTRGVRGVEFDGSAVRAACGESLAAVMSSAARLGLGGAEQLWLIPGSIGGAVRGNAGAHGLEMADLLESAELLFADGRIRTLPARELGFGYRSSILKNEPDCYLVSAKLRLAGELPWRIYEKRRNFSVLRRKTQPTELPSLGSVFKRYGGVGAGYYIDRAGLKGLRIGDAAVSEKHAGFVVNLGSAAWRDVERLIGAVEDRVFAKFGIRLEREIETLV